MWKSLISATSATLGRPRCKRERSTARERVLSLFAVRMYEKGIFEVEKSFFIFVLSLFILFASLSQTFPGKTWQISKDPAEHGFSIQKLKEAEIFSKGINTATTIVVVDGVIAYEWGEVTKKYLTHSVRKSFVSTLYGKYIEQGRIDINLTLGEIGIDDEPPLNEREKSASIRDCLKARSCVYHDCIRREGSGARGPADLILPPGTHFLYNNWDFNVVGAILENYTDKSVFQVLEDDIAKPIGMEHFTAEDGWKMTGEASIHPGYPMKMTARDMARFGLLMLNNGNWNGEQVVPESWVKECTAYHSDATRSKNDGYGYMWWVAKDHNKHPHFPNADIPEGSYSARGRGGHHLLVVPEYNMVIVHRVDTFIEGNATKKEDFGKLVQMIFDARI